ncbi:hypothetical protein COB55_01745 [Candidatus Wolfebacteria bacterium]|nr:MAG: hypothetical protein COB55_01745 [Candidatus Wolfebacteria bacterium]
MISVGKFLLKKSLLVVMSTFLLIIFLGPLTANGQNSGVVEGRQPFDGDRNSTFIGVGGAPGTGSTLETVVDQFLVTVNLLIPVVVSLALLVFFWGLAKFMLSAGDETGVQEGKQLMLWGTIALFIMVSIFGIVGLIAGDFGGDTLIPQL